MATDAERGLACGDAVAWRCDSSRDADLGTFSGVQLSRCSGVFTLSCNGRGDGTMFPRDPAFVPDAREEAATF